MYEYIYESYMQHIICSRSLLFFYKHNSSSGKRASKSKSKLEIETQIEIENPNRNLKSNFLLNASYKIVSGFSRFRNPNKILRIRTDSAQGSIF